MIGSEDVQISQEEKQIGPSILMRKPFEMDDVGVKVQSLLRPNASQVS